ncbi:MAG TPA: NFACT RNA binding domain-containing protein [Acidobacteriota bacterium]
MALNRTEIAALVGELAPRLEGRVLLFARPAGAKGFVLAFGPPQDRKELLIDLSAETSRLHLRSGTALPGARGGFLDRLEAELAGRVLRRLAMPAPDRWVRLEFDGEPERSLVVELMGRRSQAYLLAADGAILARALATRASTAAVYQSPQPGAGPEPPSRFEPPELSAKVENHYAPLAESAERRVLEQRFRSALQQRRRRLERRIEAVRQDLAACAAAAELRQRGELLKTHLHQIRRGAKELVVRDYFSPGLPQRTLPLDPKQSPRAQIEACFRRARKLDQAEPILRRRLHAAQAELAEQEKLSAELEALGLDPAASLDALFELGRRRSLLPPAPKEARRARVERALPYRIFRSHGAQEIWVGKGAAENDRLTFRHARGYHLWMHVRGTPGSHVVIPLAKGIEPEREWLLDAAELAAHYSKSNADPVEVAYTRQRWVRKFRGARPGQVLISQEKVLYYRRDAARRTRLLTDSATRI